MESGTIKDLSDNAYAGTNTYNFTTVADTNGRKEGVLPGFDKAYYLNMKLAALQADPETSGSWAGKDTSFLENVLSSIGFTAESHYMSIGYREGLAPNAYFNPNEYKLAKAIRMFNAGGYDSTTAAQTVFEAAWTGDVYQHYLQYGSKEGINPSNSFDESSYYNSKLTSLQVDALTSPEWTGKTAIYLKSYFENFSVTPLEHYIMLGAREGIVVTPVPTGEQVITR
jgi:hypothetical protein